MVLDIVKNMSSDKIGYVVMTILIIMSFLFQAFCFTFNTWYRADMGTFLLKYGLWEMKIFDDYNVTGLDKIHHEKAEFRFYNSIWKSAMDKMEEIGRKSRVRFSKNKKVEFPEDVDPMYNEIEHFKPGDNWYTLPKHRPDTIWDRSQSKLTSAEVLYSISWLATFSLMCLFAFHQFVPSFEVTVPVMRLFCAALFIDGFFTIVAVLCYGSALPKICEHMTSIYKNSQNHQFARRAAVGSDCSFGSGYSMSVLSGIFLILTGIITAIRIYQLKRGQSFDLAGAAGTAYSVGKTFIETATQRNNPQPAATSMQYDWSQETGPSVAYTSGYDQGPYNAATAQGGWEQLQ